MSAVHNGVAFNVLKLFQVWTVLLTFSPSLSGYNWSDKIEKNNFTNYNNLSPPPAFDDYVTRNVDATVGQTLLLPCTVRHIGDKVVSWIRSKDLHILTSGPHTFSSDSRFEIVHPDVGDFWGLRIRGVQFSDTGQYECQVNTDPKMSLAIHLSVTVPGVWNFDSPNSKWVGQALIKGPSEVYVRDGSPVTFTCEISPLSVTSLQSGPHGLFTTAKPRVRWLHDSKELSFEAGRQSGVVGMNSDTWLKGEILTSVLRISQATWEDGGRYTCMQPSVKPDSVKLFVTEAEHSEAMQRDFPVVSKAAVVYHCSARHYCRIQFIFALLLKFYFVVT